MKKIELKSVPIVLFGEEGDFLYRNEIKAITEMPANPEKGVSIDEMRKSIRILDKLEGSSDILELEDADFEFLLEKVRKATWGSNNRVFVEFVDYFEELNG